MKNLRLTIVLPENKIELDNEFLSNKRLGMEKLGQDNQDNNASVFRHTDFSKLMHAFDKNQFNIQALHNSYPHHNVQLTVRDASKTADSYPKNNSVFRLISIDRNCPQAGIMERYDLGKPLTIVEYNIFSKKRYSGETLREKSVSPIEGAMLWLGLDPAYNFGRSLVEELSHSGHYYHAFTDRFNEEYALLCKKDSSGFRSCRTKSPLVSWGLVPFDFAAI